MEIYEILKKNKIKKIEFAKRAGLKSTQALKHAVRVRSHILRDSLVVMLLERSGINVRELIKNKL